MEHKKTMHFFDGMPTFFKFCLSIVFACVAVNMVAFMALVVWLTYSFVSDGVAHSIGLMLGEIMRVMSK